MSQLLTIQETRDPEDPVKILPGGLNKLSIHEVICLFVFFS